nr:hypothetical protein [Parageobacillus thermoglucosidasius]
MEKSLKLQFEYREHWDIEWGLGGAAYDRKIRPTAEQSGILWISSINLRNSEERKNAYGRVLPVFCKRRLANGCLDFAAEWNGYLNELKSDGVEPPRWYGFHRICTACVVLHLYA